MPAKLGAAYWRERAEKARAQAEQMRDPTARRTLLDIAQNYEQLAEQAERIRMASFPSHSGPPGEG
jgi:hypothetical protein